MEIPYIDKQLKIVNRKLQCKIEKAIIKQSTIQQFKNQFLLQVPHEES
jgi:hypothetical protein